MEVDGVAREVALGPAPVTILDEETGKGGQKVVAAPVFEQLEVPFLEQRQERSQSGGADLLASPNGIPQPTAWRMPSVLRNLEQLPGVRGLAT